MNYLLPLIVSLSLCSVMGQAVERLDSITTIKEKAKAQKTDYAIYAYGGDWDHMGTEMKKTLWDQDEIFARASKNILAGVVIVPEGLDKEQRKAHNEKYKDFKEGITSLPCLYLLDQNGFCYFKAFGSAIPKTTEQLASLIRQKQDLRQQRDALIDQAQKAQGIAKAECFGKAAAIGGINHPKSYVDEIKKNDPKDTTGYVRRFNFSAWNLQNKVNIKQPTEDSLKLIDEMVKDKAYTPQQKQEMLGLKSTIQRKLKKNKSEIKATFEQMKALDPSSVWGKSVPYAIKAYCE